MSIESRSSIICIDLSMHVASIICIDLSMHVATCSKRLVSNKPV